MNAVLFASLTIASMVALLNYVDYLRDLVS
jgi:hypothetical protein